MNFEDLMKGMDPDATPEEELEKVAAMDDPEEVVEEAEEEGVEEAPAEAPNKELEDLRAERAALQKQLQDLSVNTRADRQRLETLEKTLAEVKKQEEAEEAGPTAADVVAYLDDQIAKVDAALAKAEVNDPSKAPALRQQLRVLERYYHNYASQAMLEATRGPDPETVVSQAVQEATVQGNFNTLKSNIVREFPILDTKSPYFNEQLRDQVHDIYNPMIQAGGNPVESLAKATMLVMRANGILSLSELAEQHANQGEGKEEKGKARKAAAVQKNVKAAKDQPPNLSNVGAGSAEHGSGKTPDFGKMHINDFMKMTDAQMEEMERTLEMYEG